MWRLRRETERGWNDGFHINTRDEAQALCQLLNKLEREVAEAKEQYSNLDDQVSSAMMVIRGLERERDRLAEALRELCETLLNDKPRDITESLYKAGDALAAWKGGSDE
jgi:predicted  nucleic acid-binding Zn-ribbon protein